MRITLIAAALAGVLLAATAARTAPPSGEPAVTTEPAALPLRRLLTELDVLRAEAAALRKSLAEARLAETEARRELEELRQFITDHRELGADFEQYTVIRALAERDARQREIEANRDRREAERDQRRARREAIAADRAREEAETNRLRRYRDAGFGDLGLDVFASRMGFSYATDSSASPWVDYDPLVGFFYRPGLGGSNIDYSKMTISGSVLNASPETRNIAIAITFFDESGNQVGSEIVQVNNARPDVPYPFTSQVEMALNRPFTSSSTYVLYADAVVE